MRSFQRRKVSNYLRNYQTFTQIFFRKKALASRRRHKDKKVIKDKNLFSAFFVLYDFMSPPTALSSGGSFASAGETGNYFQRIITFLPLTI